MVPSTSGSLSLPALFSSLLSQTLLVFLLLPPPPSAAPSLLLLPPSPASRKRKRHTAAAASPSAAPAAPPDGFPLIFRMSSSSFEWLSALLEPLLDSGPTGLPAHSLLAVALFRLATGCSYGEVARAFKISEHSARSSTRRLCRVLCTNFRFWLAFPTAKHDVQTVTDAFDAIPGSLPDCCGAIAFSKLPVCGDSSVHVQVVADPSCRILSIGAGCGGRKGGSWEGLRGSSLYRDVEDGKLLGRGLYLVAGEGYPLLPWVMVPFLDAEVGSKEDAFNEAHRRMLIPVRRTVRSLMGWGVLGREMVDDKRRMGVACVGTCAILHNMLLSRNDYSALADDGKDFCEVDGQNGTEEEWVETLGAEEATSFRNTLAEKARELRDGDGPVGRQLLLLTASTF